MDWGSDYEEDADGLFSIFPEDRMRAIGEKSCSKELARKDHFSLTRLFSSSLFWEAMVLPWIFLCW
jgi:hypothetical protein